MSYDRCGAEDRGEGQTDTERKADSELEDNHIFAFLSIHVSSTCSTRLLPFCPASLGRRSRH